MLTLFAAAPARGTDGPFDSPRFPVTVDAAPTAGAGRDAATPLSIRAYRAASRFQGPRCPHRPRCSAYASEALSRHGPILGSFVGAARLLRGARSSALRALDRAPDGALLDPLSGSTFFLEGARR